MPKADVLQIKYSVRAQGDLNGIWRSIFVDNPSAADRVLLSIERRTQQLIEHPLSGPPRFDLGAGMRHLVAGPYLILYRVTDSTILIVRVFHGNRRFPAQP